MENQQLVNFETLVAVVGDDSSLHIMLLKKFSDKIESIEAELTVAEQTGNWKAIGDYAHKYKSSSLAIGAETISNCFLKIEQAANMKDMAQFRLIKDQLFVELRKLQQFISELDN